MDTTPPGKINIPRFPNLRRGRPGNISRAARDLGVSPSHLSRVVRGLRESPEQLARYKAWCKKAKVPFGQP